MSPTLRANGVVYTKRLRSNRRCGVSALAEDGRLCTPVDGRVHRERPLFGRRVKPYRLSWSGRLANWDVATRADSRHWHDRSAFTDLLWPTLDVLRPSPDFRTGP
jgi:hypothetical protein